MKGSLLLDNATTHLPQIIGRFSIVEIVFLPANTTSLIPPMDAGIIPSLKQLYRKLVIHRLLDFMEEIILKTRRRLTKL